MSALFPYFFQVVRKAHPQLVDPPPVCVVFGPYDIRQAERDKGDATSLPLQDQLFLDHQLAVAVALDSLQLLTPLL